VHGVEGDKPARAGIIRKNKYYQKEKNDLKLENEG